MPASEVRPLPAKDPVFRVAQRHLLLRRNDEGWNLALLKALEKAEEQLVDPGWLFFSRGVPDARQHNFAA